MNKERQQAITETLFINAGRIPYGSVAVVLKIHEGRVVEITYTVAECVRQKEKEVKK